MLRSAVRRVSWARLYSTKTEPSERKPVKTQFSPTKIESRVQVILDREKPLLSLEEGKVEREPFLKNVFLKKFDERFLTYPEVLVNERVDSINNLYTELKSFVDRIQFKDIEHGIPDNLLQTIAHYGVFSSIAPHEFGGKNHTITEFLRIMEAFGSQPSLAVTVLTHNIGGLYPILTHGSMEQKSKFVPNLTSRKWTATLVVPCEEEFRKTPKISAKLESGSIFLNGSQKLVSNAEKADLFTVVADVDGKTVVVLVESQCSGIVVEKSDDSIGLKGSGLSTVTFKNVEVPRENLLGSVNDGSHIENDIRNKLRCAVGAAVVGTARHAYNVVLPTTYRRLRQNLPLLKHHAIKKKLVDMNIDIYSMESSLYMTAAIEDVVQQPDTEMESIATRIICLEAANRVLETGIDILGVNGLRTDSDLQRWLHDVEMMKTFDSSVETGKIQMGRIGLITMSSLPTIDVQKSALSTGQELFRKVTSKVLHREEDSIRCMGSLYQFVHPSCLHAVKALDFYQRQLPEACRQFLNKSRADVNDQQLVLSRIGSMILNIYESTNVIGRASRSYCIGHFNSYIEVKASRLLSYGLEDRFRENVNEISAANEDNQTELQTSIGEHILAKKFSITHPIQC